MRYADMKNMLPLLFACLGLVSCTEHRLHRKISRQFGGQDTITVRMADIIRTDWDTMYVFQPMSHHPGLEHYHDYPCYHDIGRRIVFVKDGAVVFREDEIAVEWPYSITFDNYRYAFTPETAVFRAVRVTKDTSRKYIELHLMQEPNTNPVTVDDFVGTWRCDYLYPEDPDPADDMSRNSFELILEKDSTRENALVGWHCSSMRGGRKIDCADKKAGDEPSIHGRLHGDMVHVRFESGWEVEGYATIRLDSLASPSPVLIWELCEFWEMRETLNSTCEHYMPQRATLQKTAIQHSDLNHSQNNDNMIEVAFKHEATAGGLTVRYDNYMHETATFYFNGPEVSGTVYHLTLTHRATGGNLIREEQVVFDSYKFEAQGCVVLTWKPYEIRIVGIEHRDKLLKMEIKEQPQ